MPEWLSETIISVPMIEECKEELKEKGLLYTESDRAPRAEGVPIVM